MDQICEQFEITRQAHYQKVKREKQQQVEDALIVEMVRQVRRKHPHLGTRKLLVKIQPMLVTEGLKIGRDRLFRLLRQGELLIHRQRSSRRTTIPGYWRTPNLLPGLTISHPNQVWVCDITYLEVETSRFAYLFLLMDLFSRCIVGWHVATSLAADGAVESLRMALRKLPTTREAFIHHSDHGVQYTSRAYMELLIRKDIRPSMGEVGNCYDNIFAERVIGTLKREYFLDTRFPNHVQLGRAVKQAVHHYNTDRPHLSLNMAVPWDVYWGVRHDVPLITISPKERSGTDT
jgi:transposase InsO family protein